MPAAKQAAYGEVRRFDFLALTCWLVLACAFTTHPPKFKTPTLQSQRQEFLTELRRVTALTAQSTAWDPRNVCRAIAHAATAQRCVLAFGALCVSRGCCCV